MSFCVSSQKYRLLDYPLDKETLIFIFRMQIILSDTFKLKVKMFVTWVLPLATRVLCYHSTLTITWLESWHGYCYLFLLESLWYTVLLHTLSDTVVPLHFSVWPDGWFILSFFITTEWRFWTLIFQLLLCTVVHLYCSLCLWINEIRDLSKAFSCCKLCWTDGKLNI